MRKIRHSLLATVLCGLIGLGGSFAYADTDNCYAGCANEFKFCVTMVTKLVGICASTCAKNNECDQRTCGMLTRTVIDSCSDDYSECIAACDQ